MSKRVLLTGAAGFLGSHCLRHIMSNTDWTVVAPVTFKHSGTPERLQHQMDGFDPNRLHVVEADLSVPVSRITELSLGHFDYVINYASESHVDRSITSPGPFVANNVNLMLNILDLAVRVQPEVFIQISTDEVYGPAPQGHAHREWEVQLPSNPYSASKSAQEAIAFSYWRSYGLPVVITNCMNLVGEMQDPEKFVPMIISRVLRGSTITIHGSPEGQIGSRFYLHARNLADAILFLIERGQFSKYPATDRPDKWHIVGEREVDNLEMAKMVAGMLGKPNFKWVLESFHSSRPGHDLRYALDGSKLERAGWKRPLKLDESLERLVEWTLKHPEWYS